jgi:hypothetical protein
VHLFMGFGVAAIFAFVFAVILGGFFMWIAAKISGVRHATFGRAMLAAVGTSLVSFFFTFVFHFVPVLGNLIGFIIGLVLTILVIKGAFDTTTGKAVLVWIFNIVAVVIAVFLASIIGVGTAGMLGGF